MKKIFCFIVISAILTAFCACKKQPEPISKEGLYFDTIIGITLYDDSYEYAIDQCFSMADEYEKLFSTTIESSDVSRINKASPEFVEVDKRTLDLLNTALDFCKEANGSFDITIGKLSKFWNKWEPDASSNSEIPYSLDESIENEALQLASQVNYKNIMIKDNMVSLNTKNDSCELDLGGIAKGYIADKMKEYLISEGINEGFINLGGNVITLGPKKNNDYYTIGIQKPFTEDGTPALLVKVKDASVVTSGTYQRYYRLGDKSIIHHILDPKSGLPCNNGLDSVTIITKSSTKADALSTICFLMGYNKGMEYIESLSDTEAVFILSDGTINTSSGMGADIPYEIYKE